MHRQTGNLDALRRNAVVDQLATRVFTRDEIKRHVVTSPPFPESVTRISHHGNEWNTSRKIQLLQNTREDVLRQRVYADHDVRAPALKQLDDITDAAFVKKLARLRTDAIHAPVKILHPMLPVAQYPVVQTH